MPAVHRRRTRGAADNHFNRVVIDGALDQSHVDPDFDYLGEDRLVVGGRRFDDSVIDHIGERWNGGKRHVGGLD